MQLQFGLADCSAKAFLKEKGRVEFVQDLEEQNHGSTLCLFEHTCMLAKRLDVKVIQRYGIG